MTEFNGYKLKPLDYKFKVGDILVKVLDDFVGELAIVSVITSNQVIVKNLNRDNWSITRSYWRAIETLPGSQAKAGDTVYCISDTGGSCNQHDSFKVKKVSTDAIYAEPGQKLIRAKTTTSDGSNWAKEHFVVLVKTEQPKYELYMPKKNIGYGWYVYAGRIGQKDYYLRQDLTIQQNIAAYWPTEAEALAARAKYLGESVEPKIKVGSHWSFIEDNTSIIKVVEVDSDKTIRYKPMRDITYYADSKWFLRHFKPRPDLDNQVSDQSDNNTIKQTEKQMPNFNLTLLIKFLAEQAEEKVDATNAKHIGILAESDGSYVGYVYTNTLEELENIVRQPENESRKLHIFDYSTTLAQKPRKVIAVERA